MTGSAGSAARSPVCSHAALPTVSVVIPTYNNARYIGTALDSVFAQSCAPVEVIVVDDGSTDDTKEVVSRYGERVRYVYQPNQGLAVARNTGLSVARGDCLTYLDADDVWEPDNLLVKSSVLLQRPDLSGVFSEFSVFHESRVLHEQGTLHMFPVFARTGKTMAEVFGRCDYVTIPGGRQVLLRSGHIFATLFWGNFILPTSMVLRRSCALEIGEFRPELRTQQDYEYWLRVSRRHALGRVEEPLVRYRRHASQLTDYSRIEKIMLAVRRIVQQYEKEFRESGRHRDYRRRMSGIETDLAKVYIGQRRLPEAWASLKASVHHHPWNSDIYVAMVAALMPNQLLKRLMKRAHRVS
jgi:glycosyltransferase involved in cell wall biosynthesis